MAEAEALKTGREKGWREHVDSFRFFCFEITSRDSSIHIFHDSCSAATIDKHTVFCSGDTCI